MPKSLIMYQSLTGNTEKVALRFKEVFEKKGWQCDVFKIDKNTDVNQPVDFSPYDFVCIGSGVNKQLPEEQIAAMMFLLSHGKPDPHKPLPRSREETRIIPGPKKGIVFVTYGGMHLDEKEAEPSLTLLEVEMEHLRFKCAGRFCCPGNFMNIPYLIGRPNAKDLLRAELFLEEKLED
jgi:hypothetical protein